MDNDYEDLLYTNRWLRDPEITDLPPEEKEKFRRYYQAKREKKAKEQLAKEVEEQLSTEFEPDDLLNTNRFVPKDLTRTQMITTNVPKEFLPLDQRDQSSVVEGFNGGMQVQTQGQTQTTVQTIPTVPIGGSNQNVRSQTTRVTGQQLISTSAAQEQVGGNKQRNRESIVSIDSRFRDKTIYEFPNDFVIPLDREYTSVQRLEIVSIEFPNTDFVINTDNNQFRIITPGTYLTNSQIAGDEPFGEQILEITPGNYTVDSLLTEIENEASIAGYCIKGVYDSNTNIVTFYLFSWSFDGGISLLPNATVRNNTAGSNDQRITISTENSNEVIFRDTPVSPLTFTAYIANAIIGDNSILLFENFQGLYNGVPGYTIDGFYQILNIFFSLLSDNTIDLDETPSGGGVLTVTVPLGLYRSMAEMAQVIEDALNAASVLITYEVRIDTANRFVISGDSDFDILWITGPTAPGMRDFLQFLQSTDDTGGSSYASSEYRPIFYEARAIDLATNRGVCELQDTQGGSFTDRLTLINNGARIYATTNFALDFESSDTFGNVLGFPERFTTTLMNNPIALIPTAVTYLAGPGGGGIRDTTPPTFFTVVDHELDDGDLVFIRAESNTDVLTRVSPTQRIPVTVIDADTFSVEELIFLPATSSPSFIQIIPANSGNFTTKTLSLEDVNLIIANGGIEFAVPAFPTTTLNFTATAHGFVVGNTVKITGLATQPPLSFFDNENIFTISAIPDANTFTITFSSIISFVTESTITTSIVSSNIVTANHKKHTLQTGDPVKFYEVEDVGGLVDGNFNDKFRNVTVIDENTYTIELDAYPTFTETGGGIDIRMVSQISRTSDTNPPSDVGSPLIQYGLQQVHSNTVRDDGVDLYQAPNMDGEAYAFLTSQTLQLAPTETVKETTNNVKNIFAKIQLNEPPGSIVFNSFIANDITFIDRLLPNLRDIQFTVRRPDGTLYDLNRRDFSLTLRITEVTNRLSNAAFNSQSGKIDDVFTI